MIIVGIFGLGFAAGTTLALLLLHGGRRPAPPFVRTAPRPTDWTNHEGRTA